MVSDSVGREREGGRGKEGGRGREGEGGRGRETETERRDREIIKNVIN